MVTRYIPTGYNEVAEADADCDMEIFVSFEDYETCRETLILVLDQLQDVGDTAQKIMELTGAKDAITYKAGFDEGIASLRKEFSE